MKSVKDHHADAENELLANKVPRSIVASKFKPYQVQKTTLQKRKSKTLPAQPPNIQNIDIAGDFGLTLEYLKFLQYDNKSENQRVIILACDEAIKLLAKAKTWHIDGTFKSCPKGLMQIFTIHAHIYDQFFPCAYIIMQHKNEKSYREVFSKLKDLANDLDVINYNLIN